MDLHQRFFNSPTVDFSILQNKQSSDQHVQSLSIEFMKAYDKEISKGLLNKNDWKSYRMILCNEYQTKGFKKSFVEISSSLTICDIFLEIKQSTREELLMFCDIVILKLALFKDSTNILQELKDFQINFGNSSFDDKETRLLYMKMIECILDVFRLLQFLDPQSIAEKERIQLRNYILKDIETWYDVKDDSDWKTLIHILPKLIEITGLEVSVLWELILRSGQDLKNSLTGLCILIHFSLDPEVKEKKNKLLSFFSDKRLWEILLAGLKSQSEFERKQALHLFKIITEFLQKGNFNQGDKLHDFKKKIPFVCDKSDSINLARNNYILILESLDEKQQHMVIPSLSLLDPLILANAEHEKCGNCFEFVWLSCILEKILQHENNSVVKWGLSYILKLNPTLYNDQFLKSVTETLNNRFLYECENDQYIPQVVSQLQDLLIHAENLNVDLIPKFLLAIVEICWDPVAIFYVTLALRFAAEKVQEIYFHWKEDQLIEIKSLVEKNLKVHSPFLRSESQRNVIISIAHFTKDVDLKILSIIFSAFPNEEALSRGSKSWKNILDWLQNKLEESEVEKFICEFCTSMHDGSLAMSIESFTRVFVLFYDLNLLNRESRSLAYVIELLSNIQSIKSRPYINFDFADRIFEFIYNLMALTSSSEFFHEIASSYLDSTLEFLLKSGKRCNLSYDKVQKYSAALKFLISEKLILSKTTSSTFPKVLEEEAIYCLQNANDCSGIRRLHGMNILYLYQKQSRDSKFISLLLEVYMNPMSFNEEESLSGVKGKVTTEYYTTVGKIINCYLENSMKILENVDWFWHASSLFDKAGASSVPLVIGILLQILQKELVSEKDLEQVKLLVTTCWKSTFEGKKNHLFWAAIDKHLKLTLNPKCFGFKDIFVQEVISRILKEGEAASNLKMKLLENLESLNPNDLINFQEPILDCLLHGQILRRDGKIKLQAFAFLFRSNHPDFKDYMDASFYLNHNLDVAVRTRAVVLLYKAITSVENYSSKFFPSVIKRLNEFKEKRYFSNSNSHRIQQRIFQVMLILAPLLDGDCIEKLKEKIFDIVLSSTDQLSVQIMMSWILTRIYSEANYDKSSLWDFFKKVKDKRPGNVKFMAGIILHVSKLIKDKNELSIFVESAISHLAPECLGPTFSTRLACQIVIVKLYEIIQDTDVFYKSIKKTLAERNFRITNEFYYNDFHAGDQYNLQSIYYDFPRLTNMSEDELIPPTVFEAIGFFESNKHPLKLWDEKNSLWLENISSTVIKSAEKISILNNDFDFFDLQKKIIPQKWTNLKDLQLERGLDSHEKDIEHEGIIVVASLVEKAPNLGGIARTCEVFGAKELVVGCIKSTESKEFQSLSVTAEKWIKVTEVKAAKLTKYLIEMQEKGWKLVGVEQTAYSSNLLEIKFDKRTILVLGNEKDGIPPHLIPMLDTCVEIPQIGVIRSLNVHVSGAICIWTYAKQHLLH